MPPWVGKSFVPDKQEMDKITDIVLNGNRKHVLFEEQDLVFSVELHLAK